MAEGRNAQIAARLDEVAVPGIGRRTAFRIHHDLGLDTLEELETAAGRLRTIAPRRLNPIRPP